MKKFIFSVLFALVFSFSGFSQDISGINTDELVATIASAFNQAIKEEPSNRRQSRQDVNLIDERR